MLVKYCFGVLGNLVHSSLWHVRSLVSYYLTLHHKLIRMAACWLLFHSGSNSITFLQNVTLTTLTFLVHRLDANGWPTLLSLLPFWTPSFCIKLSDAWWPAIPKSVVYPWSFSIIPHSNSLENSEKSRWFHLSCGRQSKVWELQLLPVNHFQCKI